MGRKCSGLGGCPHRTSALVSCALFLALYYELRGVRDIYYFIWFSSNLPSNIWDLLLFRATVIAGCPCYKKHTIQKTLNPSHFAAILNIHSSLVPVLLLLWPQLSSYSVWNSINPRHSCHLFTAPRSGWQLRPIPPLGRERS